MRGGAFVGRLAVAEEKADAMGAATDEAEEKADAVGLLHGYSRGGGEGGRRGRSWRMVRRPPAPVASPLWPPPWYPSQPPLLLS